VNLPFEKQDVQSFVASTLRGQRVEPDGPVPCDLAVVGQDPDAEEERRGRGFVGRSGEILWGGEYDLIGSILGRPRDTVYVSYLCKQRIPDNEWARLTNHQKAYYWEEIKAELRKISPKVVLAFGKRVCQALVPGFRSITRDQGQPVWGYGETYIVMPLWHPAAYLRGNTNVITDLAVAISQVPILLKEGLPKPIRHGPSLPWKTTDEFLEVWPENISFLSQVHNKESVWERPAKCSLCGKKLTCRKYEGEGLKWTLCQKHAILTEQWAKTNEPAMREHVEAQSVMDRSNKIRRAADRIETKMRKVWEEKEHYQC
jgi:uracil-DNA glycosylase family 4